MVRIEGYTLNCIGVSLLLHNIYIASLTFAQSFRIKLEDDIMAYSCTRPAVEVYRTIRAPKEKCPRGVRPCNAANLAVEGTVDVLQSLSSEEIPIH